MPQRCLLPSYLYPRPYSERHTGILERPFPRTLPGKMLVILQDLLNISLLQEPFPDPTLSTFTLNLKKKCPHSPLRVTLILTFPKLILLFFMFTKQMVCSKRSWVLSHSFYPSYIPQYNILFVVSTLKMLNLTTSSSLHAHQNPEDNRGVSNYRNSYTELVPLVNILRFLFCFLREIFTKGCEHSPERQR